MGDTIYISNPLEKIVIILLSKKIKCKSLQSPKTLKNGHLGSVLIAGGLEGKIENQINLFKTIIKDTYLSQRISDAKFEGKKNQKLSIELIDRQNKKIFVGLGKAENLRIEDFAKQLQLELVNFLDMKER